jgi:hypothetical protein
MKILSIILGIFLILIGISIIASRSGYFPLGFWERLIDFWPFILLIIGLGIISKGVKVKWPFTLVIIILLIVPFIVAIVNPVQLPIGGMIFGNIDEPFDSSIKEIELNIDSGAGKFKITGGSDRFISGEFSSGYARLIKDKAVRGDRLIVSYRTEAMFKRDIIIGRTRGTDLALSLNDNIPFVLDLKLGASTIDFDLSKVIVKNLKIDAGASSLNITFGAKYPSQSVIIKAGASNINLKIPKELGIRARIEGGLSTKKFHNIDLVKRDDIYESANYNLADKKLDLEISSGVSNIDIYGY